MTERIFAAQQGETVPILTNTVVRKPCESKSNGHWYCVTHHKSFVHNFDKDTHISTGRHMLVWICHEHGAEQP